jgi:hypothetical protein
MMDFIATLPALHLPSGDLLPSSSISKYITKEKASSQVAQGGTTDGEEGQEKDDSEKQSIDENAHIQTRTYTSLVESKLQPALVSAIIVIHLSRSCTDLRALPLYT